MSDNTDTVNLILQFLASNRANSFLNSFFNNLSKNDGVFDQVLARVAKKLETKYKGKIDESSMFMFLENPHVRYELKKVLEPYSEVDNTILEEHIDFSTLPTDFRECLREFLIEELSKEPKFKSDLVTFLQTFQIDDTHQEVKEVHELAKENNKLLKSLTEFQSDDQKQEVKEKVNYVEVKNYISRTLSSIDDIGKPYIHKKRHTLIELLSKEKKITVLSVAGYGKSIELSHLAHIASLEGSEFYPYKISLNTYTGKEIEQLLDSVDSQHNSSWRNIPPGHLLVIMDGLDEVNNKYFEDAVLKINAFANHHQDISIVVSCRNNFYTTEKENLKAKLNEFKTYYLNPFSYEDINSYIKERLGYQQDQFNEEVEKRKIQDFLYNPFLLIHLVTIYKANGTLPSQKKEIFESIIKERFRLDKTKFENTGAGINDYEVLINKEIQRLALALNCLGKNYLTVTEFQQLVKDKEVRNLLKHTFLFNKKEATEGIWVFEHNNLQEYLAAKLLIKSSFSDIQALISFGPENQKVKPSWLNTLSFAFQLLEVDAEKFKKMLDWLTEAEADVLIRFEKERISLDIRENIFKSIYQDYQQKGIFIGNEKFDYTDLISFVSESEEITIYLIDKIKEANTDLEIYQAVILLPNFDDEIIEKFIKSIEILLVEALLSKKYNPETKLSIFYTLSKINTKSELITEKILAEVDITTSKYLRAGMYKYLVAVGLHEKYIGLFLEGIKFLNRGYVTTNPDFEDNEKISLSDERYNLELGLKKATSYSSIIAIIQYVNNFDERYFYEIQRVDLLNIVFDNAVKIYEHYPNILEDIIELMDSVTRRYHEDYKHQLREFFRVTGTSLQVFQRYLNKISEDDGENYNVFLILSIVANKDCCDPVVSEYHKGRIKEEDILKLRNYLNRYNAPEVHDYFYHAINSTTDNRFTYSVQTNYEEIRKARNYKDLDLILDKEAFVREAFALFVQKQELTIRELYGFGKKHLDEERLNNEIVVNLLRDLATEKTVSLGNVEEFLADENKWHWFQLHTLVRYDTSMEHIKLRESEVSFIESWCFENVKKADFKTAIKQRLDGGLTYRYLEIYLAYFTERFNLSFPEETLLDMLFVDSYILPTRKKGNNYEDISLAEFIIDKVGLEKVKERVLYNLGNGIEVKEVLMRHFQICKEHNIQEALPFLLQEITGDSLDNYQKRSALDYYFELNGSPMEFRNNIDQLESEVKHNLISHLAKLHVNYLPKYLINQLNDGEDENKLIYAQKLVELGYWEGIDFIKTWIIHYQSFPDISLNKEDLLKLPEKEVFPILFSIFEASIQDNFQKNNFTRLDSLILDAITDIGSRTKENFEVLKDRLQYFIKECGLKYLNYQQQNLEQRYYLKQSQSMSIDEVIEILDLL